MASSRRKLLHVASVFPENSNRVALQCNYARDDWHITLLHLAACREDVPVDSPWVDKIQTLPRMPRHRPNDNYVTRRLRSLIRRILDTLILYLTLIRSDADVAHAHENSSLWPLAFWVLVLRRPAVWDPHDYFHEPLTKNRDSIRLAMLKSLERAIVRHGTPVLTVSDGMCDKFANLHPDASITIIQNYSSTRDVEPVAWDDADRAATQLAMDRNRLGQGTMRLVYPGLIKRERLSLELIKVLGKTKGVSLDIYGHDRSGSKSYESALKKTLAENKIENINLLGPYNSGTLIPILREYHFALFPFELLRPNIDFCLPNKFFQCIEAGLPLITSNMKDLGGIIEQHGLGFVFPYSDNKACAEILQTCSQGGTDYLALVRNVLVYQATQVDYDLQRAALLQIYTAALS